MTFEIDGVLRRGRGREGTMMDWSKLLSEKRVRELSNGAQSTVVDNRTQFERDYDRAIFCTPVRRLHDKAQVFPLEPNDSVRTRLTHSLEVSTVSRDVARTIGRWLVEEKEVDERQARAIETIAATCGIIHDLGNPPFGHAGEVAIREWFKSQADGFFGGAVDGGNAGDESRYAKDFLRFEGNAQTLRLVSKLQVLADLYGLNFTCGTVSAACKYIARSDEVDKSHHETSKVGYFASEEDLIERVREETGTGRARNPITFLVEACDDAVYSVVDLEDGIKKRVITWPQLHDRLLEYSRGDHVLLEDCFAQAEKMLAKGREHDSSIETDDEARAVAFRVYAINHLVKATVDTFKDRYDEIMAGEYHGELIKDGWAASLHSACYEAGKSHVYCADQNLRLEVMGKRIIHDLMDIFWDAVDGKMNSSGGKDREFSLKAYKLMSGNYRTVFDAARKEEKLPVKYCCMQLMTDYICGMTDTFACTLHRQLLNG